MYRYEKIMIENGENVTINNNNSGLDNCVQYLLKKIANRYR